MTGNSIDWDADEPTTPEEEYWALIRALRRTEGFGIILVRCNDAREDSLICQIKADLPEKAIEEIQLTADSTNFYEAVQNLSNGQQTNILFVRGLKDSLLAYEQTKRAAGWTDAEIYSYSWKGVPKILTSLNQQRDRLRNNFNICFVFLLPLFGIKYLIHRAPDFFDWRSGIFEFPMQRDLIEREFDRILKEGDYYEYLTWTNTQRYRRTSEIQDLLEEPQLPPNLKVHLLFDLATLAHAAGEYKIALLRWNELLKIQPNDSTAWNNQGIVLADLKRYEEAIASYDKAIAIEPNDVNVWKNRGSALFNMSHYEKAINC